MHISKFVNNPDGTPLHDSGLAADGPSSRGTQSFSHRRAVDRSRQTIGGYNQSLLGTQYVNRDSSKVQPKTEPLPQPDPRNRQEANTRSNLNVPPRRFQELPSRGFNPYN